MESDVAVAFALGLSLAVAARDCRVIGASGNDTQLQRERGDPITASTTTRSAVL
jgi:hypothetical protein